MDRRVLVEICAGDLTSALEAGAGGADRVELCDNLAVGGTTPSAGTIAEACSRLSIPVHVLIRPRGGDFVASEPELAAMRRDLAIARDLGAAGVVLGVLRPDATIDRHQTATLAALARPMSVTFHKAFDQTPDLEASLETLIELGIDRVLTSGGRPSALEGLDTLARLVRQAEGRITVLIGGRLNRHNLPSILDSSQGREIHLGSAVWRNFPASSNAPPRDESKPSRAGVDAARVSAIVNLVRSLPIT